MMFDVTGTAYWRFMGRYSEPLAALLVEQSELPMRWRALDVGCGPGAVTSQLVQRLGPESVSAIDPSSSFVEAVRERCPGVDVREAVAEHLPYADDDFGLAVACLVVHFMIDPVVGLAEMARVTRPGGRLVACVWDLAGGTGPLAPFWRAARDIDPAVRDESQLAGGREGHLGQLAEAAGWTDVDPSSLSVTVPFESLAQWWEPFTLGVGPAGAYVSGLGDDQREQLRARCAELMPRGAFEVIARAWSVRGRP